MHTTSNHCVIVIVCLTLYHPFLSPSLSLSLSLRFHTFSCLPLIFNWGYKVLNVLFLLCWCMLVWVVVVIVVIVLWTWHYWTTILMTLWLILLPSLCYTWTDVKLFSLMGCYLLSFCFCFVLFSFFFVSYTTLHTKIYRNHTKYPAKHSEREYQEYKQKV